MLYVVDWLPILIINRLIIAVIEICLAYIKMLNKQFDQIIKIFNFTNINAGNKEVLSIKLWHSLLCFTRLYTEHIPCQ